jgi:hypothetical protein
MRVEQLQLSTSAIIYDAPSLDPIIVILRDPRPGVAQIVIACFSDAWTAYWGNTGHRTARDMLLTCSVDYLLGCFWPKNERRTESREQYLERIIEAITKAVKQAEDTNGFVRPK